MTQHSDFRISVGDDPEHEELTAEIYFRDQFVAIVSQENGLERGVIEIQPRESGEPWAFSLQEFMETLSKAKQRLWELRRETH
jgi:hypothetical protein